MSDLIERQAVLDWLNDEWNGMVLSVFDGIRALPSAQPEKMQLSREDATFDCISRQAAIDACMKQNGKGYVWTLIMKDIQNLPSAQPEITRCKDCKWSDWYTALDGNRYCYCMETSNGGRTEDDYCSYAERETDD